MDEAITKMNTLPHLDLRFELYKNLDIQAAKKPIIETVLNLLRKKGQESNWPGILCLVAVCSCVAGAA